MCSVSTPGEENADDAIGKTPAVVSVFEIVAPGCTAE
jgi:hypothetical protein